MGCKKSKVSRDRIHRHDLVATADFLGCTSTKQKHPGLVRARCISPATEGNPLETAWTGQALADSGNLYNWRGAPYENRGSEPICAPEHKD